MLVNKKWGHEFWIENNDYYCGKHLRVLPNKYCSAHYHKNKKETFYIIKGELVLYYSSNMNRDIWDLNLVEKIILKEGDHFTLKPYTVHRFTSNLDTACDFIEISTHHDDNDSYRIVESF